MTLLTRPYIHVIICFTNAYSFCQQLSRYIRGFVEVGAFLKERIEDVEEDVEEDAEEDVEEDEGEDG